jgi:hypothetical protein
LPGGAAGGAGGSDGNGAPAGAADGEGGGGGNGGRKAGEPKLAPDAAIRVHGDDHDDSVYAAAWSVSNAWVYASVSHSGKVVVAQVPSAEKYRVLL